VVDRAAMSVGSAQRVLDDSLAWLTVARGELAAYRVKAGVLGSGELSSHLESASAALDRLNALVHAAMQGPSVPIGSMMLSGCEPICVTEAVAHAVEASRPRSDELRVVVATHCSAECESTPSGPVYAAVLGALRSALDSIASSGGIGRVDILAWVQNLTSRPEGPRRLIVEVRDDGRALQHRDPIDQDPQLAMAAGLLHDAGGTLHQLSRPERARCERVGATTRLECPIPGRDSRPIGREERPS
jgi:hypothetical protein